MMGALDLGLIIVGSFIFLIVVIEGIATIRDKIREKRELKRICDELDRKIKIVKVERVDEDE